VGDRKISQGAEDSAHTQLDASPALTTDIGVLSEFPRNILQYACRSINISSSIEVTG
jgi:hypothetical protein